MLVRRCDPKTASEVSMKGAAGVAMQVMVGRGDHAPSFALRHFVIEPGGHTPHHSHPYEHEVYVVAGTLAAECDGSVEDVSEGDVLFVPSGAVHQFVNRSPSTARFLCVVPLESDCGQDVPGS